MSARNSRGASRLLLVGRSFRGYGTLLRDRFPAPINPEERMATKISSTAVADERHFRNSVQREKLVEHLFTGQLLRYFWRANVDVDLLRPEVDRLGYDIVVSHGRIVRHIQLKASILGGKASAQTVSASLTQHPGGCVVWMVVDQDLNFVSMRWFGGRPGKPIGDLDQFPCAVRTTPNSEGMKPVRENTRRIPRSAFEVIEGDVEKMFEQVAVRLFGRSPKGN